MPLKVRCVSQADLSRGFFLGILYSSPIIWSGNDKLVLILSRNLSEVPNLDIYIYRLPYFDGSVRPLQELHSVWGFGMKYTLQGCETPMSLFESPLIQAALCPRIHGCVDFL
jgi:hypothetical protein